MENSIKNVMSAISKQNNKADTDLFNGFQISSQNNLFDSNQSTVNNINQINQATCSANTTNSASDNYIYVTNSDIKGNFVGVTDTSNASADCNMSNYMKNNVYNQAQASSTQLNSIKGMFAALMAAVTGIVVVIIIGVIVFFSVGAVGHVGYGTKPTTGAPLNNNGLPPNNQINQSGSLNSNVIPNSFSSTSFNKYFSFSL